ncbi:MAG: hypothetical protein IJA34_10390 [Lachnospiraceae bacterium]|nr:hypothetical protein [Lachnospiraceae bacterium]
MKKSIYACILFVAMIVAFVVGMLVGKDNHSKDDAVGVYQTNSWNGKIGTLILYEDGTCQYPSGENATWKLDGNTIHIKLESSYSIKSGSTKGIVIYIDTEFSDEKINEILHSIELLENIESISRNEETNIYEIKLIVAENDNKTSNELLTIEGVKIVEHILEKEISTSEHEAKVIGDGLVLHEQYFEKVSD